MAYPSTSDWRSATQYAAWFVRRGPQTVCQTDGLSLLDDLYIAMTTRLETATGAPVSLATLQQQEGWTADLLRATAYFARVDRAPADYQAAIDAAAAGGPITPLAMSVIVWQAVLNRRLGTDVYGVGTPSEVEFGGEVLFPYIGLNIARPGLGQGTGLLCRPIAQMGGNVPAPIQQPTVPPVALGLALALLGVGVLTMAYISRRTPVEA